MNIIIRPMRVSDIKEIVLLDKDILGESLGETTLKAELENPVFGHYFVLEDDVSKEIIGHISLWIDVCHAQIMNYYVVPLFQRQGFGEKLLDFAIAYLINKGVIEITLEVKTTNEIAKAIYQKKGFVIAALRKNYYPDGKDAYLMLKKI